jgi:peptidoglycan hydrolase CwlO-like protein
MIDFKFIAEMLKSADDHSGIPKFMQGDVSTAYEHMRVLHNQPTVGDLLSAKNSEIVRLNAENIELRREIEGLNNKIAKLLTTIDELNEYI